MVINTEKTGGTLTVRLAGRLDTVTAPDLEKALETLTDGATLLVFDLKELTYTSSAGLRVFLKAQKRMNAQGKMKLINVCPVVMEVLEMTGFTELMDTEAAE